MIKKAYPRLSRVFAAIAICLGLPLAVFGYDPNATSPFCFVNHSATSNYICQDRVGDGFWYDTTPISCAEDPGTHDCHSDSRCPIGISNSGAITPPIIRPINNNTQLEVEYFARNAYCSPAADGGPYNVPITDSLPYTVRVVYRNASGAAISAFDYDPYWEHGKFTVNVNLSCSTFWAQAIFIINESLPGQRTASSGFAGPIGQDANGRNCLDDRRGCPVPSSPAGPVNVGSGNMHYEEPLFSVADAVAPMDFRLVYNSREINSGAVGVGFTHTFAQTMKPMPASGACATGSKCLLRWTNGRGEQTLFYSFNVGSEDFTSVWPGEARGSVHYDSSGGTYALTDLNGTRTVFRSSDGQWKSTADRWGNAFTSTYNGTNLLTAITNPETRSWTLAYSGSQLTSVTDPANNIWQFGYDGSGHLQKIADPGHTLSTPWRTYTYVQGSASEPTVLANVADSGLVVLEGHEYDSAGRATSSWSGDTTSGNPHPGPNARSLVTLSYDSPTQTTVRSRIDSTPTDLASAFAYISPAGRILPTSIVVTARRALVRRTMLRHSPGTP
jgi:YD repeat-containing protein